MMKTTALLASILLFTACSKAHKDQPATTGGSGSSTTAVATGSGSAAATKPIPPYTPAADTSDPIKAAIAATDRADDDRALDAGRKPGEVFTFFKLAPGQKIGELFSGGGYSTELMARIVGDSGVIYAQNTKEIMDKFARKTITDRLAKPVNKNVKLGELPTETPFPPEAKDLDAVVSIINYHDFVWMKVDRAKMNKAVYDALKPGGIYAIVDSSAAQDTGVRDCETLHRIDEDIVKKEVGAAGFQFDAESPVLRNPDDKRDWNSSPKAAGERRGTSDRFVLRFVKPT